MTLRISKMINKIVCGDCGSKRIYIQTYVNVNSGIPEEDIHYLKTKSLTDAVWCTDCQTMVTALEEEEFEAIKQEKSTIIT